MFKKTETCLLARHIHIFRVRRNKRRFQNKSRSCVEATPTPLTSDLKKYLNVFISIRKLTHMLTILIIAVLNE